jgi:hypothetical protein
MLNLLNKQKIESVAVLCHRVSHYAPPRAIYPLCTSDMYMYAYARTYMRYSICRLIFVHTSYACTIHLHEKYTNIHNRAKINVCMSNLEKFL